MLSADNSLLTFGQGPVVARARVAVAVLPALSEGMPVVLTGADGATLQGTLGAIPAPPSIGDETVAEVAVPVVTTAIDDSWLNTNVLTTITVSAVAEEALRVPSRAVALRANGTGVVQRLSDDGSFREIEVRELGRLGGTSAIEPISPGDLSAGDQVNVE
ncbi:MAG: hypothetical protein HGA44_23105 [Cellulomonadaceae bacterium]|nr:hypothetical protein [Cellulomonadaceae bacterium]